MIFAVKNCGNEFTLHYKSFKAYDDATPRMQQIVNHLSLSRVINRINVASPSRDYTSDECQRNAGGIRER